MRAEATTARRDKYWECAFRDIRIVRQLAELPNGLRRRRLRDLENRTIILGESGCGAQAIFLVAVLKDLGVASKKRIGRRHGIEGQSCGHGRLVYIQDRNVGVTGRLSGQPAGSTSDYGDTAVVSIVENSEPVFTRGVRRGERGAMLSEEPACGVGG